MQYNGQWIFGSAALLYVQSYPPQRLCNAMQRICPHGHTYRGSKCLECRQPKRESSKDYGWKWDQLSRRYREINPLCEDCDANGRITPCTEVHHIVPILQDKSKKYDWDNLVALCKFCHNYRHKNL